MKLEFDDQAESFRRAFSTWLDANMPDESGTAERSRSSADIPAGARRWQQKMFDAGWLVPGNPTRVRRPQGHSYRAVRAPRRARPEAHLPQLQPQGLGIVVPSILAFGTHEQKQRWAIPLLRAEITAALGMSEPDAGSDLAGFRTRAVLDGDRFIVNGQNVWTSGAHDAD
jgi:alkylation response protein AidB-like acyl-CoA dehydrogenase